MGGDVSFWEVVITAHKTTDLGPNRDSGVVKLDAGFDAGQGLLVVGIIAEHGEKKLVSLGLTLDLCRGLRREDGIGRSGRVEATSWALDLTHVDEIV